MKTLLLMRHAKSSWKSNNRPDHDRPLNKRGKRDAPSMGRLLRDKGLQPDVIVSSTARRARKTAAKVLRALQSNAVIELRPELYEAAPADCISVLNDLYRDYNCVLLVGHNPCFEELMYALTGEFRPFPTAAIARIDLPIATWRSLGLTTKGRLADFWEPRKAD